MRLKSILLASTGALALISAAPAQADGFYVSVLGGANFSEDERGTFTTAFSGKIGVGAGAFAGKNGFAHFEVDTGFTIAGAVGFGLDQWLHGLSIEIEPSYRRNNIGGFWDVTDNVVVDNEVGAQAVVATGVVSANLSTFALMANLWYEFDIGMRVKPYIGGGVGWGRAKLDGFFEDPRVRLTVASVDPFEGFNVENNGFAYQFGIGLNTYIMPGAKLGIGYRYFDGPNIDLDFGNVNNAGLGINAVVSDIGDGHAKFDNVSHTVALTLGIEIN